MKTILEQARERRRREQSTAKPSANGTPDDTDDRPLIPITHEEHEVTRAALEALAAEENLFHRRGQGLVRLVRVEEVVRKDGVERPADHIEITKYTPAILSETLTRNCVFTKPGRKGRHIPCRPPKFTVEALLDRGEWPGLRQLTGVVESPVLRWDGTILDRPGYDHKTGLYLAPSITMPDVPAHPTADEVRHALGTLADVVTDFPFARPEHRSAHLALLLTLLARNAFDGPAPLTLIDANTRGAGKGLAVHVVAMIATGRPAPISTNPTDDNEMRKRITTLALAGDQIILIDNVAGRLGTPSLDAALTCTEWYDRLLGFNEGACLPLRTVWAATGNNVQVKGDLSRRTSYVRLESSVENPEERTGFRHPDLLDHVRRERGALLHAALTILRGWYAAGRPKSNLPTWGSYEGWSDVVRSAIVWAGLPDPGLTRVELRKNADEDGAILLAILKGITYLDPDGKGITAAEIVKQIDPDPRSDAHSPLAADVIALREALVSACRAKGKEMPSSAAVGYRLRSFRGRIAGGLRLENIDGEHRVALWRAVEISAG